MRPLRAAAVSFPGSETNPRFLQKCCVKFSLMLSKQCCWRGEGELGLAWNKKPRSLHYSCELQACLTKGFVISSTLHPINDFNMRN